MNKSSLIRPLVVVSLLCACCHVVAEQQSLERFAHQYFEAWVATQQPEANEQDLEAYLALLSDHVAYEHKPYRLLEEGASAGGKGRMRAGMTHYLGASEAYEATLASVVAGPGVIAIQYQGVHVFRSGGEGPMLREEFVAVDVLEMLAEQIR